MSYTIKIEVWDDDADARIAAEMQDVERGSPLAEWRAATMRAVEAIKPTMRHIVATEAADGDD